MEPNLDTEVKESQHTAREAELEKLIETLNENIAALRAENQKLFVQATRGSVEKPEAILHNQMIEFASNYDIKSLKGVEQ